MWGDTLWAGQVQRCPPQGRVGSGDLPGGAGAQTPPRREERGHGGVARTVGPWEGCSADARGGQAPATPA